MEKFLAKNPNIKKALKVFEISHSQYENALDSGVSFYSSASTQPKYQTVAEGEIK